MKEYSNFQRKSSNPSLFSQNNINLSATNCDRVTRGMDNGNSSKDDKPPNRDFESVDEIPHGLTVEMFAVGLLVTKNNLEIQSRRVYQV